MVVRLLRQRTLPTHERVESQLALLDDGLTVHRLTGVIRHFYGFWAAGEPAIQAWSEQHPAQAHALHWQRRRRTELFAQDLRALGMSAAAVRAVPHAGAVFPEFQHAQVLGWLYVTEGSTLGGAIIDRHLHSVTALAGIRLASFTPYSEGPGAMWRSYRSVLQDFTGGDVGRTDAVVEAAQTVFDSLERWLRPLAMESA